MAVQAVHDLRTPTTPTTGKKIPSQETIDADADAAANAADGGGSRKRYVRIVTDKRREQNRRAQKAYRDRLKRKLEDLEGQQQQNSSVTTDSSHATSQEHSSRSTTTRVPLSSDSDTRRSLTDDDVQLSAGELDSLDRLESLLTSSSSVSPPTDHHTSGIHINLEDAFVAAGDLPISGSMPGLQFHIGPDVATPTPQPSEEPDEDVVVERVRRPTFREDYGDLDLKYIWKSPPTATTDVVLSPGKHYNHPLFPALRSSRSSSSSSSTFDNAALMMLTPQTIRPKGGSPNGAPSDKRRFFSIANTSSDPYLNNMRLTGEANLEAFLSVGLAIGVTRTAYINDHPSHFPACYVMLNQPDDPSSKTTSYRFSSPDTLVPVTPELNAHMARVQPSLRPTMNQLLRPHPAYLDCIVFSHFRDRAVQASADGLLVHYEMFLDILHGGLVCWGGRSGLANGHSKRDKRRRDMRDAVAWSPRSWEAARWFLRKWTWLVGTEADEEARGDLDGIWRVSRWWWAMRGEDDDSDCDDDAEEVPRNMG